MTKKRRWLAIGAAVFAAAAAAVALTITLTGGGGSKQPSHSDQLSDADFARLWHGTHVGEPEEAVLERWPKDPYQHYTDNLKDDCFEWSDEPLYLYNLCFSDGVLRSKDLG
jgi:hypothetical protein